ncbi:MAG TPA: aminopeptidase N [Streptosporangiaceae bacterium]|nr:aminopeptidase N [Streptosporangiaceae bacterium]
MQIAEITQQETAERAALLRVDAYDVQLDLTRGDKVFRSVSSVRFDCTRPGAASYADLVAETVHEITLNGTLIDPGTGYAAGRIALPGLAEHNELRVVADCAYSSNAAGLMRTVDSADGKIYTASQFEPADARSAYANFEQPDLKAEFTFHVTAPAQWTVLSNQPAPDPEPAGHGTAVWHFPPTPRMSTYLTVIVAGEYHLIRDAHTTPDGQVIPLGLGCRQSLAAYLDAADILGITRQGLDYFTGLFGGRYPYAKYDQVFVADHIGAMENIGCVTISEQFLFRSKVTDAMYEQRAMVILHEMSHQWFGDLVTMRWWGDLWLNESFAEYCATLSSAEATRFTGAWTTFCSGRKVFGYMQDQQPSTHPVAADVATLGEAVTNFDGISYAKGASVLKQLVAYLGRDQFFAGVRAYFAEHGWANATLADLLQALETSSGRSLADWSKAWLETAGPNTLRPDFSVGAQGTFTAFAVLQEAPASHPTLRPHRIAIGLYDRSGDTITRRHQVTVDVTGPRTAVPGLTGQPQPDLILLNDDDLGYAIVRFDPRSLATLAGSIGQFTDSLARTVCWSAVIDMALQAELSLPAFVRIVAAGLGQEPSISVLQILHQVTRRLLTMTGDPHWVPAGKQQLADVAVPLLRAAEPGSDRQLAWAQLLSWTAVTDEQLGLLDGLLGGQAGIPGLVVDTELRWALLARLASTGRAGDARIDAELARDDTDAGRRHAAACRASIPDAAHKSAAWRLITEPGGPGIEDTVEVGLAFNQAEHAELLAGYADRFLTELPAVWAALSVPLRMVLGQVLFPYPAASPDLLATVDAVLAGESLDPAFRRAVIEGRDVAEKALRARALPS